MKIKVFALAAAMLALVLPVHAEFDSQDELAIAEQAYRAITAYHVILQGDNVSKDLVTSALFDVERYVEELDNHLATSKLFVSDQQTLDKLTETVAKAHLQAALLHARGIDLEGSITQYEKVVDLLGYDLKDWDTQVEKGGRPGALASANEMIFDMAKPVEIMNDLEKFWSIGVVQRFRVREYAADQLTGLMLQRVDGPKQGFYKAAFQVALERFHERLTDGEEEFRVVLPPGRYRVTSPDTTVLAREFTLRKGKEADIMILNPNTFSFEVTVSDERCRPTLSLNGAPVKTFNGLPFGTYSVTSSADCPLRLPNKITVQQRAEVTLRTEPERLDFVKEGQPIFLFITTPPGSTYTLRM